MSAADGPGYDGRVRAVLRRPSSLARQAASRLDELRHRARLRRLGRGRPPGYHEYLAGQLERTLSKRENDPGAGARLLVERAVELGRLGAGSSVLCVGCRNTVELDLFRARGVGRVVGVDLFSQHPDILVMDMHALAFPDATFDAVYASHSLEHSHDLPAALREIARVARPGAVVAVEVPVRHRGHDADLIEFSGLDDLREQLEPFASAVLWEEEQPARTETNEQGSAVARMVVSLG